MITKIKRSPFLLSAISLLLFTLSWNVPSFPILIFFAFAPLFALLEVKEAESKVERFVFGVVTLGALFSKPFSVEGFIGIILFGATIAYLFKGFQLAKKISSQTKKITLILGILAVEFVVVKFQFLRNPVFIADSLQSVTHWTLWNYHTGYLGMSCWILIVNLFFYKGILKNSIVHWPFILVGILIISFPLYLSSVMDTPAITRYDMEQLYQLNGVSVDNATYEQHGELIARTTTWISVLMIIFIFVKMRTKK